MDTHVSDEVLKTAEPPSDDTDLAKALSDLDSKLAAWSGAINCAQTSIKKMIEDKPRSAVKALPRVEIKQKKYEPPPELVMTSDDENVMASLDPETAQKIRVLRRLNGNRQSVRQLVEQFKASSTGKKKPDDKTGKKTFWRR